jgi:4,5-dihydroxyphthalate decarboxylase
MAELPLVLSCGTPTFEPLWDGTVQLAGIAPSIVQLAAEERHRRMFEDLEFDVCEFSSVNYLRSFPFGLPFTAIPVFPLRRFRHRDIWILNDAGIETPAQLNGRRVGIQMWSNSALLWQRAALQRDHGLDLASVEWVAVEPDDERYRAPAWARLTRCPADRTLEDLLLDGEIAAMMIPHQPRFTAAQAPRVRRLFPDYVAIEQDYYQRTGLLPIMHNVVIKDSVLAEHPWVAASVYQGLQRMLDVYVERLRAANAESVHWPGLTWAEQEARLGRQPWPSGLAANRETLQTAIDYSLEQGIITEPIAPDALFQYEGRVLAGAD